MMDHIVTLALMSLVQALIEPLRDMIKWAIGKLTNMPDKLYSSGDSVKICCEKSYTSKGNVHYIDGNHNDEESIAAISRYIHSSDVLIKNSRITVSGINEHNVNAMPSDVIVIDGVSITYSETITRGKDDTSTRQVTMILRSKLGTKYITDFIVRCRKQYYVSFNDTSRKYTFYQVSDEKLKFARYILNSKVTFDQLFFQDKAKLLTAVEKYASGDSQKLNLLLHGTPGCGKTSIIKALANHLGKHIVVIKLSSILSDSMLMEALHSEYIDYDLCRIHISASDKIYVFEDIDAEISKVLQPRAKKPPSDKSEKSSNKSKKQKSALTLSGILNALDGITEFNSVLVATTNHPENLDPAFTRYGRFNMKIRLGLMSSEDATSMIRYYYPQFKGIIEDAFITPAALGSYINTTDTLEGLLALLSNHSTNDI